MRLDKQIDSVSVSREQCELLAGILCENNEASFFI